MVPPLLNMVDFAHRLVGPKPLEFLSRTLNKGTGNIVPTWNPYLPRVRFAMPAIPSDYPPFRSDNQNFYMGSKTIPMYKVTAASPPR